MDGQALAVHFLRLQESSKPNDNQRFSWLILSGFKECRGAIIPCGGLDKETRENREGFLFAWELGEYCPTLSVTEFKGVSVFGGFLFLLKWLLTHTA